MTEENISPVLPIYENLPEEDGGRFTDGFRILHGMNWFDYCYSDQFAVGFHTQGGGVLKNCFCWWYSGEEALHLALRSDGPFFGSVDTLVIGGAHHPDHPNRFVDPGQFAEAGAVSNVTLIHPDGRTERIR